MTVAGLENGQRHNCPRGVVIVSVCCVWLIMYGDPHASTIHSLQYICEYSTGHINIKGKIFHMYFSCSNFRAFIGVDIRRAVGQVSLT